MARFFIPAIEHTRPLIAGIPRRLIAGIPRRLIAGIGAKKNGREDASSSLPLQIKPSFWGRSTVVRGLVVDGYLLFSSDYM
jgi:hypothetical protein